MEITIKGFACNWESHKRYFKNILKKIAKLENIKLSDNRIIYKQIYLNGDTIQAQRSQKEWSRCLYIYFDDDLKYIIAMSNTNYDEDKQIECNQLGGKSTYGVHNYHGNSFLFQGSIKQFDEYYEYKKKYPNVKLLFYLQDTGKSYVNNSICILGYRKLATIGFNILNIDEVDFSDFNKKISAVDKDSLAYSSLNKLINDICRVSSKKKNNKPSYVKVIDYDYDIENDEIEVDETWHNKKYIYTFKALSAEGYDSFITVWALKHLADKEGKKIEFLFSKEKFNFASKDKLYETKGFVDSVTKLMEKINLNIVIETSSDVLQNLQREKSQFEIAKKKGKLRNQELFKNNIREKGIETKCCLCGCEIEEILEAAHLWGVAEIKKATKKEINSVINQSEMKDLVDVTNPYHEEDFYSRYVLANSGDNGVWLCKNHHGLYDNKFYCFDSEDGKVVVNIEKLKDETEAKAFFDLITKYFKLSDEILTPKTKIFLSQKQL